MFKQFHIGSADLTKLTCFNPLFMLVTSEKKNIKKKNHLKHVTSANQYEMSMYNK
jgi:hypothetical protein